MRSTLRTFALIIFSTLLLAGSTNAQDRKVISEKAALSKAGRVVVNTYKGSISISTWDREEVTMEAIVEADRDEELVQDTEVHFDKRGDSIYIESDYDKAKRHHRNWFGMNEGYSLPFVRYTLHVPRTAKVVIDDYKSDIDITDLTADVELETYKGRVDIKGLVGTLDLETYKGDVRVAFNRLAGNSNFETYKGDIDIRMPRDTGFDLDADLGRRGSLDSDFDMPETRYARYRGRDDYRRGAVNGGGPRLHLETYKGTFTLRDR